MSQDCDMLNRMNIPFLKRRPKLSVTAIQSFDEYVEYARSMSSEYKQRQETELALITDTEAFTTDGFCYVCDVETRFHVDFLYSNPEELLGSTAMPNWRERLICSTCELNNRIRASIQFLEEQLGTQVDSDIYITEQTTPLFSYLKSKYPKTIGSEYLGQQVPFGESHAQSGIRNESITKLTFGDTCFDFILSFDVFEHVPEYRAAFAECLRCLKPGGVLLFTVPFILTNERNQVRAQIDSNGEIQHLFEPEYHGDPVSQDGCLCFNYFAWEMLEEIRSVGFKDVSVHFFWSEQLGYLGLDQILFTAKK